MKKLLLKIFGAVFLVAGTAFMIIDVREYTDQLIPNDWESAEATVTQLLYDTDDEPEIYDVEYIFDVPHGGTYYGYIRGVTGGFQTKDTFEIKYDPNNPDVSTAKLKPDTDILLFGLGCSALYIIIGIFALFGIPKLPDKLKKYGMPRRPYSSKPAFDRGYPVKLTLMAIADGFSSSWVALAVGAGFILLAALAGNQIIAYIAGSLSLLMFFAIGIWQPSSHIRNCYTKLGSRLFYRAVDDALRTPMSAISDFTAIMNEIYKYIDN